VPLWRVDGARTVTFGASCGVGLRLSRPARGVLLNVSGPPDLGLFEVNQAAEIVWQSAHPDANIIFGAVLDDQLADEVRITVIAAGIDRYEDEQQRSHAGDLRPQPPALPRYDNTFSNSRSHPLDINDEDSDFADPFRRRRTCDTFTRTSQSGTA
jgi:hypothetical protein